MKYIVMELQTDANGTVGNFIFTYSDRNEAESKYHLILGSAAVSQVYTHTAVLLTNEGHLLEHHCYHHIPEPEPEPEPEVEPEEQPE